MVQQKGMSKYSWSNIAVERIVKLQGRLADRYKPHNNA